MSYAFCSSFSIDNIVRTRMLHKPFIKDHSSFNAFFAVSSVLHPFSTFIVSHKYRVYFIIILYSKIKHLMITTWNHNSYIFIIRITIWYSHCINISVKFNTFMHKTINIHIRYLFCWEVGIATIIISWWTRREFIKCFKSMIIY